MGGNEGQNKGKRHGQCDRIYHGIIPTRENPTAEPGVESGTFRPLFSNGIPNPSGCQGMANQETPSFMEPGGSMPHSQGLSNNPYS